MRLENNTIVNDKTITKKRKTVDVRKENINRIEPTGN